MQAIDRSFSEITGLTLHFRTVFLFVVGLSVCVAKIFARIYQVTDKLFDLFYFRKTIVFFAVKNFFFIDKYFIRTADFAGL
jgi:hypothetical protein